MFLTKFNPKGIEVFKRKLQSLFLRNLEKSSPSLGYTTVSSGSATLEGHGSTLFCVAKWKKWNKEKKRKSFKAETIKRLSPESKCYCFSHSRVSKIQKSFLSANHGVWQYCSVFHCSSSLKSILPPCNNLKNC